jgi:hypothetical protein
MAAVANIDKVYHFVSRKLQGLMETGPERITLLNVLNLIEMIDAMITG